MKAKKHQIGMAVKGGVAYYTTDKEGDEGVADVVERYARSMVASCIDDSVYAKVTDVTSYPGDKLQGFKHITMQIEFDTYFDIKEDV